MSLYTGTVRGLSRAPYRDQVLIHLIGWGAGDKLSEAEERKVERVKRFLHAEQCAREILAQREKGRGLQ